MGQSYRELIAWQKAMDFVMEIYRATKAFPRDEIYSLATSLRRAESDEIAGAWKTAGLSRKMVSASVTPP